MANLARSLLDSAARDPGRTAVKLDDIVLSYGALDAATARIAGLLAAKGVAPGDRVALMMPNVPYFPIIYFGILRRGAVVVPLNPLLKEREVAYHLSDSGARLLFAWHQFDEVAHRGSEAAGAECILTEPGAFEALLARVEPLTDVAGAGDDEPAVLVYTSGTTGVPKGAQLTHGGLADAARVSVELVGTQPESILLGALPLFHVFGMSPGMNAIFRAGGTMTLMPRFDPGKALEIIQRDRVDIFLGVPTMYIAMLHHPEREAYDTSTLRLCVSGGAALPVEVLRGFDAAFECKVLEGYGLSETCALSTFNRPDRERKPGSIGLPVEGVQIRLVDDDDGDVAFGEIGELIMRSPHVMRGYHGREDDSREALRGGWLHTGDLARVDADGYYYIVDRKKDMIIRGGYNVYPREIEEVLYEHPAVRDAAVVGVADERLGEEVAAFATLKPGASASADELVDFVKERVAAYKYPRQAWVVENLPMGPTGKVLKREIQLPSIAEA